MQRLANALNRQLDIRWRRGALALSLHCHNVDDARESVAHSIAAWIGQQLAARPPFLLTEPTIIPPASERNRLRTLLRLASIVIPTSELPVGYAGSTAPRAGNVAWHAVDADDPRARVLLLNDEFWLLINLQREYTRSDDASAPCFVIGLSESASDAGAARQMMAEQPAMRGIATRLVAPAALGDPCVAYRTVCGDERGVWSDSIGICWRRGRFVLAVSSIGTTSAPSLDDAVRWSAALERAYQRSSYAR